MMGNSVGAKYRRIMRLVYEDYGLQDDHQTDEKKISDDTLDLSDLLKEIEDLKLQTVFNVDSGNDDSEY